MFKWVDSRGQYEKHRCGWTTFPVGLGKFSLSALCILHSELLLYKIPACDQEVVVFRI